MRTTQASYPQPRPQRPTSVLGPPSTILSPSFMQTRSNTVLPSIECLPRGHKRPHPDAQMPTTTTTTTTGALNRPNPTAPTAGPVPVVARLETPSKRARDTFFDSLVALSEAAKNESSLRRKILCPDDLEKPELLRFFNMLHSCGKATQPDASLATTRKSIEGFLCAIFKDWKKDAQGSLEDPVEPVLDIQVTAEVQAGATCTKRKEHKSIDYCFLETSDCVGDIFARASYSTKSSDVNIVLVRHEALDPTATAPSDPPIVNPLTDNNIEWCAPEVVSKNLRSALEKKLVAKAHKFNKHMAVWQARKLIVAWSSGDDAKQGCHGDWGFIDEARVKQSLIGLGVD